MKNPFLQSILIIVGVITMIMVVYVYLVGHFMNKPLEPSAVNRAGQTGQQSSGAGQPALVQPPGAAAPEGQEKAANQGASQAAATVQVQTVKPAEGVELKTWTGVYTGRIDNNFIEIKVGDEPRTFLAPVELIGGTLNKDDPVIFDFYKNNSGQLVLVSFKKMAPAAGNP